MVYGGPLISSTVHRMFITIVRGHLRTLVFDEKGQPINFRGAGKKKFLNS